MSEDEYDYGLYHDFFKRPPTLLVEWKDPQSTAKGWLAINSLRGGAAGGGTRMRSGATAEEAIGLAKTMAIKFAVSGPDIGGAKSVIDFDPQNPEKEGVLRRWFGAIGPYLRDCYGTGGDLNVDEVKEVIPLTADTAGITHPQEGIVRGHISPNNGNINEILFNLKKGVEMPVTLEDIPGGKYVVADLITGYGLVNAAKRFYELRGNSLEGKRILLEGWGNVGGPAGYYFNKEGAKVVGIISASDNGGYRWIVSDDNLDTNKLFIDRDGARLPSYCLHGDDPKEFWNAKADIFVPCAISHTIDLDKLELLQRLGVKMIVNGANNPFAEAKLGATEVQQKADKMFTVIPDFVANCGMARVFAYLMQGDAELDHGSIMEDTRQRMTSIIETLFGGYHGDTGLLSHAYSVIIPNL